MQMSSYRLNVNSRKLNIKDKLWDKNSVMIDPDLIKAKLNPFTLSWLKGVYSF